MMTLELILVVLVVLDITIIALLAYLFFLPFRLGPAPDRLLGDDFFATPGAMPDIRLHIDGKEAFDAVFQSIEGARQSVHVQTFIWKEDIVGRRMVEAVIAVADRGASVALSKDVLGTFFEILGKGWKLGPVFKDSRLRSNKNISVDFRSLKPVDHSKYYIIDGKEAIFGGMNIADEYHDRWHDYMVGLHDEKLAGVLKKKLVNHDDWPEDAPFVIATNTERGAQIRTGIVELIDAAKKRLVFEHAYFSADMILEGIERALARGVAVDLILPKDPSTHGPANRASVNHLLACSHAERLRAFFYPTMTHAKALVADGRMVAIGSANMTPRSLYVSGETVMFAHFKPDHPFIARLNSRLESDIENSKRINDPFRMGYMQKGKALVGKYIW
ncbi:MAG: phosphatidylserine/phosphatidylglycerophosphate/cardiolipin synthase family protein [Nitrospinota bacterium]|nr:phosphatidylserine/phosphatidylglycerophosphate/cardiolipin synthase family protein [Nitrospinota bacterium]